MKMLVPVNLREQPQHTPRVLCLSPPPHAATSTTCAAIWSRPAARAALMR